VNRCREDINRYEELIQKLSEIHVDSSIVPRILCFAMLHEFKKDHPDYSYCMKMQGELLEIAEKHNMPWTRV